MVRVDRTSLIAGFIFVGVGALFLADYFEVLDMRGRYILPVILVGLGIAVLLGGKHEPDTIELESTLTPSEADDPYETKLSD